MKRLFITVPLVVALAVACGSSGDDVTVAPGVLDAGPADTGPEDAAFPILPYPPGPYGGGIGDVLPNFTIQGYALSRTERDSRKLRWRDIPMAEVRSTPGCACLVIALSAAGTQCGPCIDEDQGLSAAMAQEPSICAVEAMPFNYDGTIQFADVDAGLVQGARQTTRADIDAMTRANRETYPVGIVTASSAEALSTVLTPLVPVNFIVRTSDMRVMSFIGGSEGARAPNILAGCRTARAPVETLANGLHPRDLAFDGSHVYVADADAGILAVPSDGTGAPIVLATPPSSPAAIALDASNVYYATREGGTSYEIGQVPKAGGARIVLDSSASGYEGIAVDATHVYFARDDGAVGSVPKGGGAAAWLATGEASPTKVVVDGSNVYWLAADTDEIAYVPKAGGTRASLVAPGAIRVAATTLHVVNMVDAGAEILVDAGLPSGLLFHVKKSDGSYTLTDQLGYRSSLLARTPSGGVVTGSADANQDPAIINFIPAPGGQLEIVTPGQTNLRALAANDSEIYWVIGADDFTGGGGALRRIKR